MSDFDFTKTLQGVSNVKLPGGVVGKACTVLLVVIIMIGSIALVIRDLCFSYFAVSLLVILCIIILWRVINFADKNPQAALLEGAEFLVHQQMEFAAKGNPKLPTNSQAIDIEGSILIDENEILQIDAPDKPAEKKIK